VAHQFVEDLVEHVQRLNDQAGRQVGQIRGQSDRLNERLIQILAGVSPLSMSAPKSGRIATPALASPTVRSATGWSERETYDWKPTCRPRTCLDEGVRAALGRMLFST